VSNVAETENARPAASVVVLSYNSRDQIDTALESLSAQRFDQPYEVIVVDSGVDDCADYVRATYPKARVVRSERRLYPGAARNRGVRAARGDWVAFLADDSAPRPDWLSRRDRLHRKGFGIVGGAVVNGTPRHPVGTADYYLEYSAQLPSESILRHQTIPHTLSYSREVLAQIGEFPEDTRTGEDTLYNQRCLSAAVPMALDPGAQIAHDNLTSLRPYLRHQYVHGRGLIRCALRYGHQTPAVPSVDSTGHALAAIFVRYPALRWWNSLRRVARGRPRGIPVFLALTPLIWMGLWATSAGAWSEWRQRAAYFQCLSGASVDSARPSQTPRW
jgi:glycosyltransferase involved in cell wall biosynthesis